MTRNKIKPEIEKKIIEMYLNGCRNPEIEKECGITQWTIRNVAKRNNLPERKYKTQLRGNGRLSEHIELDIFTLYKSGVKSIDIARKHNLHETSISRIIRRIEKESNSKVTMQTGRRYTLKEDYFETIDTELKSYFLGFIYADGSVSPEKGNLSIAIHNKDLLLLERFKEELNSNANIEHYLSKGFNSNSPTVRLSVYSRKMLDNLNDLGVIKNKTHFLDSIPDIPTSLIRHFIRGYFDGDGSIEVCKVGTYNLLSNIRSHLQEAGLNPNVKFTKRKKNGDNIYNLKYCGRGNALKFYNYVYKDSTFSLPRKRERFISLINR